MTPLTLLYAPADLRVDGEKGCHQKLLKGRYP
jgi:hypothetical protein